MNTTIRTQLFAAVFALVTLLAGGCASVPMATPEADAQGKSHTVAPGKSNIYVYRNETFGSAVEMTVMLNGKVAGTSGPQTYFLFEVEPGSHEVAAMSENTSIVLLAPAPFKAY